MVFKKIQWSLNYHQIYLKRISVFMILIYLCFDIDFKILIRKKVLQLINFYIK